MKSNFEQAIRNYKIDKMSNNEICSTLEQECQLAHTPVQVPIISNEHINILAVQDLSIRDVDVAIKDQICSMYFEF